MWYSAALFFQSVRNGISTPDEIWEQQVVLLQADTEEDATAKAQQLGKEREHEYVTVTGDLLRWECRLVRDVYELIDQDIKHGVEVYSRFLSDSQVASLLKPLDDDDGEKEPDKNGGAALPGEGA